MSKREIITSLAALMLFTSCGKSEPAATKQSGDGVLETAELTIPIPKGFRALSMDELVARVAKANRNSSTKAQVAMLEGPGRSVIGIERMPTPKDVPPTPPTSEECVRVGTWFAERGKHPIIAGGTLVEHPRDGLGASCQFTLNIDGDHVTQVVTNEWIISCLHPPADDAACQQVAAGLRRR